MKLEFCTLDGERSERDVNESAMVSELKDELYVALRLDVVAEMKLFHGTTELADEKVIADSGVQEGDIIQVLLQQIGFLRVQTLLSSLGFPDNIIQTGRELAARTMTPAQTQEREQAEARGLGGDITNIEPLQLQHMQDETRTRSSKKPRSGIATFDMVSKFVAVLEYLSSLKPHTSRTITSHMVASAVRTTDRTLAAELIFLSIPYSRALIRVYQTCNLKLPLVQMDHMDYPHSITPTHLGACIDFIGRCGRHHLMQLAAACTDSELADLALSAALPNADMKLATERLLGQRKLAQQDGLEQVLACIDHLDVPEEQMTMLLAVNAAIVTCVERTSKSLQSARTKIVSRIAANGKRRLPQEFLVEVPCEGPVWPNCLHLSAVTVLDPDCHHMFRDEVTMMEQMVPMGLPSQHIFSSMPGMGMLAGAGASSAALQSPLSQPTTCRQAVHREPISKDDLVAKHEELLEAYQALLAEHRALLSDHRALLAASDQSSAKEEDKGSASDPLAEEQAALTDALMRSKQEIDLNQEGVVVFSLCGHARSDVVKDVIRTHPALEACRTKMNEAKCELQPAWAGGAWILIPLAKETFEEAGIIIGPRDVILHIADEPNVKEALRKVNRDKRPQFKRAELRMKGTQQDPKGDQVEKHIAIQAVGSSEQGSEPAESELAAVDVLASVEVIEQRTFYDLRGCNSSIGRNCLSAPSRLGSGSPDV